MSQVSPSEAGGSIAVRQQIVAEQIGRHCSDLRAPPSIVIVPMPMKVEEAAK